MSADNTVMILETEDGFRVAEIQAAENLSYPDSEFKRDYISANFADKSLLYCEQDAWRQAEAIYTSIKALGGYVEYGIQLVKLDGNNEVATPPWAEEDDFRSEIYGDEDDDDD
jgi:hypothetical protein